MMMLTHVVHRENMALYQKELMLKQQIQQNKSREFFITGKDFDIKEIYPKTERRSQYAEKVLKYPSCDTSKVVCVSTKL